MDARVRGVTLTNRLPEIMLRLEGSEFEAVLLAATEPVAEMAQARAPIATGHLRDSIEAKPISTAEFGSGIAIMMAWYGIFAEHGTVKQAPHPFLVPAAEAGKFEVSAAVAAWLRTL